MSEIFKGFEQKYPEYSIICPQTKLNLTVRSITTSEELKLKTSLLNDKNKLDVFNKIIYNCIVNKPEEIDTYEKFLSTITLRDREAIFSGLYHVSYGDMLDTTISCNKCNNIFDVKLKLTDGVTINEFEGDKLEIVNKRASIQLEYVPAIIEIKEPTLKDELDIEDNFLLNNEDDDFVSMFLYVDKIKYFENDDPSNLKEIVSISDKIFALKSIIPKDKKKIRKTYADEFGKYGIKFNYETICTKSSCRSTVYVGVDIVAQFFRNVYE